MDQRFDWSLAGLRFSTLPVPSFNVGDECPLADLYRIDLAALHLIVKVCPAYTERLAEVVYSPVHTRNNG